MRCKLCLLPSEYPCAELNAEGICRLCRAGGFKEYKGYGARLDLHSLLKHLSRIKGKHEYDCLISYSGGKDSTFALWFVKERLKLNPLAVTMDNHLLSPTTRDNILKVTERLSVDHIFVKIRWDVWKKVIKSFLIKSL